MRRHVTFREDRTLWRSVRRLRRDTDRRTQAGRRRRRKHHQRACRLERERAAARGPFVPLVDGVWGKAKELDGFTLRFE